MAKTKATEAEAKPKAKRGRKAKAQQPGQPAKVDYSSPEWLAIYDRETNRRVVEYEADVSSAKDAWNVAKNVAKARKEDWEFQDEKLKKYIAERERNRGKPPLRTLTTDLEAQEALRANGGVKAPPDVVAPLPTEARDELWKQVPMSDLVAFGATESDIKKLREAVPKNGPPTGPINTMGDWLRFAQPYPDNPGYSRGFADLKGLGKAATDRITDAMDRLIAEWGKSNPAGKSDGPATAAGAGSEGAGDGNGGAAPAVPAADGKRAGNCSKPAPELSIFQEAQGDLQTAEGAAEE